MGLAKRGAAAAPASAKAGEDAAYNPKAKAKKTTWSSRGNGVDSQHRFPWAGVLIVFLAVVLLGPMGKRMHHFGLEMVRASPATQPNAE